MDRKKQALETVVVRSQRKKPRQMNADEREAQAAHEEGTRRLTLDEAISRLPEEGIDDADPLKGLMKLKARREEQDAAMTKQSASDARAGRQGAPDGTYKPDLDNREDEEVKMKKKQRLRGGQYEL